MFQTSDFVARMDILSSKLDFCFPLAYPSTIYKHFSSFMPLQAEHEREDRVIEFIEAVIHQRPKGDDFESFIRDAVILSK